MSMIAAKCPFAATTASSCSSLPATRPDAEARPPGLPSVPEGDPMGAGL
jgi:hypothetical protein